MNTEIKNVPEAFRNASVNVKIEVTSDINITSFVARQNVNVFLLGHIGNLVSAGEPALLIAEDRLRWKVPICCAVPHKGMRAIGDIAVDVNTGANAIALISVSPSAQTPEVAQELKRLRGVEVVYEITGEYDVAVIIGATNVGEINRCIDEIRKIDGVGNTNTVIILRTIR